MVKGWPEGKTPTPPVGFSVEKFAGGLDHPRWMFVAPNGDVLVAESNTILKGLLLIGSKISRKISTQHVGRSADRITLFRDADKDGIYETRSTYLENLNQPFGMMIHDGKFYVANTDELLRYEYDPSALTANGSPTSITTLPAGTHNRHWTRNIIMNRDSTKFYIAVGSGSNVAENGIAAEEGKAAIWVMNLDGSDKHIYASGLRNPVGMAWAPGTNTLWTAVNERDELGDELVPDYLTSVKENGFYGWPYSYFGQHIEPRIKEQRPDLVQKAIVPDVPLGAHTASLGLLFYERDAFPASYRNGAFVAQHGSWNRSVISGYKVVYIPFVNGKPSGPPEDFLTGFIEDQTASKVHGRPVGLALLPDGSMLVTDDVNNTIWKVSPDK